MQLERNHSHSADWRAEVTVSEVQILDSSMEETSASAQYGLHLVSDFGSPAS